MTLVFRLGDRLRRSRVSEGERGEDLAHRYLRERNFSVVARNWRPPQGGGELDIVAWDGEVLVVAEVKTRASGVWSAPERALDDDKVRALRRAARDYVRRSGTDPAKVRFDLIAITGDRVEHMRDAVAARLT